MTIAGLAQLLDAIRPIGLRYPAVLQRQEGETLVGHLARAKALLEEALRGCAIDEVVLDATNRMRFAFARAVLKGLEKSGGSVDNGTGQLITRTPQRGPSVQDSGPSVPISNKYEFAAVREALFISCCYTFHPMGATKPQPNCPHTV
jgi:hypothetical protein